MSLSSDAPPGRGRQRAATAVAAALVAGLLTLLALDQTRKPEPAAPAAAASRPAFTPPSTTATSTAAQRSARALIARPRTAGVWPGATGLSGVNGDPVLATADVEAFCTARGRPCQVAQTYTDRTSWESMTRETTWTFDFFTDFAGLLVVSQGLVPDGREADLSGCAAGAYDQNWRDFGSLMVKHGRGDSVVRLGWEFNEATMSWRATSTQTWIDCYRRAATGIRATNPDVLLDWTINAHGTPAGLCDGLSTNCWPGDAYVDIVGIDNYDHYPWSPTRAAFDATAARPEGLTWLYDFARAHGKLFSVGEWGVAPTGDAGRENPDFIIWMHDWFAAHASDLAYEAYFTTCEPDEVRSNLFRTDCARNSSSAEQYRNLFKG